MSRQSVNLNESLDKATKQQILSNLFDHDLPSENENGDSHWEPYFAYYASQCQQWRHATVKTHEDIVQCACQIKQKDRDSVKAILKTKIDPLNTSTDIDTRLDASINLTTRLLLMLDIGVLSNAFAGRDPLIWNNGLLQDYVHQYFSEPQRADSAAIKLEKVFTARNLERIASLEIIWTNNLADHLRMTGDDRRVSIFHFATFLQSQQRSIMFPEGFIEETLETLALLLPKFDRETERWYSHIPKLLDKHARNVGHYTSGQRQIRHFRFWHDRLVILKQVFDESRPKTLKQWWIDRRNPVQWSTFWVAILVLILTIFFGLVQSVEGAMQVYKAYHPTPLR